MARSSSWDFTVTRDDIIKAAMRLIGVLGTSQDPSSTMLSDAQLAFNMMIRAWQGRGYGLWLNQELVLIPQADQVKYRIGPTSATGFGVYVTRYDDLVKTEIATAMTTSSGTTCVVDSVTGISSGYTIGIETDNGDMHWDTVASIAGTTITLTTGIDYASAVDSHVYCSSSWTIQRPLEILKAWRRDADERDVSIDIISLDLYRDQSNKTAESGTVTQLSYEKILDEGAVYLWPEPNDMKYRIHMIAKYPVQDFDGGTNNPDFPVEWFAALKYNLALHLAAEYSRQPPQIVYEMAQNSLQDAIGADNDNTSLYIKANVRSYY